MLQVFMDWQERRIRLQAPVRVNVKAKRARVGLNGRLLPDSSHGTEYGYRSGCRCLDCRVAYAEKRRAWRSRFKRRKEEQRRVSAQ